MNSHFFLKSGNLRMCFIKSSLERVKIEMGDMIKQALTKDWIEEFCDLQNLGLYNFFTSDSYVEKVKCLFWEPHPGLVVFLNNMTDGWGTLINVYNKKYKKDIIQIAMSGSGNKFPYYKYEQVEGDIERLVYVLKDSDKWKFFQRGDLLPFENSSFYTKRKIADRLNNDIIKQYLKYNNIDIDEQNFWKSTSAGILLWTKLGSVSN